jgi:hypothetical protein
MSGKGYVEYDSNNSGGDWWLTDENWKSLEEAGWRVEWRWLKREYVDNKPVMEDGAPRLVLLQPGDLFHRAEGERWLGSLAGGALKPNCDDLRAAVEEWERVTGQCSTDEGCPCCGNPHSFTLYSAEGTYIKSGPNTEYVTSWNDD